MPVGPGVDGTWGRVAGPAGRSGISLGRLRTIPRRRRGLTALVDAFYRLGFTAAFRSARLIWGFTCPRHRGALVAVRVGRSMLVLRQSYRRELGMPGGGIARGEAAATAACRELAEELGLVVPVERLREVHTASGRWDGRRDTVTFFEIEMDELPALRLDNREVVAAGLVELDEIGARDVTPAVAAYLAWRRQEDGAPR